MVRTYQIAQRVRFAIVAVGAIFTQSAPLAIRVTSVRTTPSSAVRSSTTSTFSTIRSPR